MDTKNSIRIKTDNLKVFNFNKQEQMPLAQRASGGLPYVTRMLGTVPSGSEFAENKVLAKDAIIVLSDIIPAGYGVEAGNFSMGAITGSAALALSLSLIKVKDNKLYADIETAINGTAASSFEIDPATKGKADTSIKATEHLLYHPTTEETYLGLIVTTASTAASTADAEYVFNCKLVYMYNKTCF